jgi:ABC-2 type transport system ATP-binding protein
VAAIKVDSLVKSYGDNTVIKGVSFTVDKGEIFALLGVNGAGKTTTLECIEGLRKYEKGQITIDGKIGVQLQSSTLPPNIKSIEALRLFSKWSKTTIDNEMTHSLGLDDLKNKQYQSMSAGQKRRLHLALALIGNPDIIFLDEPTAGLDVEGRVALHAEIRKLKSKGKTIIMASHDMAEVEELCDRIAILKDGEIAFMGTSIELTSRVQSQKKILLKTVKPINDYAFSNCNYVEEEQGYQVFMAENIGEALHELLDRARDLQSNVLDIRIEHATLEQSFIDVSKEGRA